jgi:FkbM family methyltransferase
MSPARLKHAARATVVRLGREEQARELLGRVREARSAFDPMLRRELRDRHALKVVSAAVLRTDSGAVDVGANLGEVLEVVTRVAPEGRHIAFEPIPELHELLVKRFPHVDVRQMALSDVAGTADFAHVLGDHAYSGLIQRDEVGATSRQVRQIEVHTERLDDVLPENYAPALVKIDVEGAEFQVLQGAVRTLERHSPVVLFEHGEGGADLYGTHPRQVFELLDGLGLRIFDLEGDGPYSRDRFEDTFTEPIWNFLAAPR